MGLLALTNECRRADRREDEVAVLQRYVAAHEARGYREARHLADQGFALG
jgi:hypothetical protein